MNLVRNSVFKSYYILMLMMMLSGFLGGCLSEEVSGGFDDSGSVLDNSSKPKYLSFSESLSVTAPKLEKISMRPGVSKTLYTVYRFQDTDAIKEPTPSTWTVVDSGMCSVVVSSSLYEAQLSCSTRGTTQIVLSDLQDNTLILTVEINVEAPDLNLVADGSSAFNIAGGSSPSSLENFTLTNSGNKESDTLVLPTFTNTTNFESVTNTCTGTSLAVGASCSFAVRGKSTTNGNFNSDVNISDGTESSNNVSLTLASAGFPNTSPVISESCPGSMTQGQTYSCTFDLVDPDVGDTHTFPWDAIHSCSWLSLNSSTLELSGSPTDDDVGVCIIGFKANDGSTDSNVLIWSVLVNNQTPTYTLADVTINEDDGTPIVKSDANSQSNEEGFGVYSLLASTSSPDCSTMGVTSIDTSNGEITFTKTTDVNGSCYIRAQFDDQNSTNNTVVDEFQVTITATEDTPTLTNIIDRSIYENTTLNFSIAADEGGGSDEDGQTVTVSLAGNTNPTLVPNGNVVISCSDSGNGCSGTIDITPAANQFGTVDLTFRVNDGSTNYDQTMTLTVIDLIKSRPFAGGRNFSGELGRPSWSSSLTFVDTDKVFSQITTTVNSACGIASDNKIYCWGLNSGGILGQGSNDNSYIAPSAINSVDTFTHISAANSSYCAVNSANVVYCWGTGSQGRLGIGTDTSQNSPTQILDGGETFTKVEGAHAVFCALSTSDEIYCWGQNGSGQVGNGTTNNSFVPQKVNIVETFKDFAVTIDAVCAINLTNDLYCWGSFTGYGASGYSSSSSPIAVTHAHGNDYVKLEADSKLNMCGTTAGGDMYCWGNGANTSGHGGTLAAQVSSPTSSWLDYSSDSNWNACAVSGANDLYCWGRWSSYIYENTLFAQPLGTPGGDQLTPLLVPTNEKFSSVSLNDSREYACALNIFGKPYCWGRALPTTPANYSMSGGHKMSLSTREFTQVALGNNVFCGLNELGDVHCSGNNQYGRLGVGTSLISTGGDLGYLEPLAIDSSDKFSTVKMGVSVSCGVTTAGVMHCWGNDSKGNAGTGATATVPSPLPVLFPGGTLIKNFSNKFDHSCAVSTLDDLYCWGDATDRQIGDPANPTLSYAVPFQVDNTIEWSYVSTGFTHTCGLDTTGAAYCWGKDQGSVVLGGAVTGNTAQPRVVNTSSKYSMISAASIATCGLRSDNQMIECWGQDGGGRQGNGPGTSHNAVPASVLRVDTYKDVKGATDFFCALNTVNDLYCWGANTYDQFGLGSTTNVDSPTKVNGDYKVASFAVSQYGLVYTVRDVDAKPVLLGVNIDENSNLATNNMSVSFDIASNFTEYCILENDTNVGNCSWVVSGTLPSTVVVSTGIGRLSVWLKSGAAVVSDRVDSPYYNAP